MREAPRGPRAPAAPSPPRKEGAGWAWGIGGLLVGILVLVVLVYLFRYLFYPGVQQASFVSVPGVTGLSEEQARQVLEDAKLAVGRVREDPESTQPAGTVVSQEPEMGEHVPEGTEIKLVVARADETKTKVVEVIRVVGLSLEDAEANLRRVRLKLGTVDEVYDENAPKGEVVAQSVPPGTQVAEWEGIGLTVSKGPKPPEVEGTEPGAGDEKAGPGEDQAPDFEATEVPGASDDPTVRQFRVSLMAQGSQQGQHIQIFMRDDRNPHSLVIEGWLDPGDPLEKTVTTHGSVTFEIYRDGQMVDQAPFPQSTPSGPGGEGKGH